MTGLLLAGVGGALGSEGRFLRDGESDERRRTVRHGWPPLRLFFAVGFLGGFTTFSSFSLDSILLLERGAWIARIVYIGGSVLAALAAFCAGFAIWRFSL